jgi:hypothetical protein
MREQTLTSFKEIDRITDLCGYQTSSESRVDSDATRRKAEAGLSLSEIAKNELYDCAKKCYELLKNHGRIEVMEKINHLGVIKK